MAGVRIPKEGRAVTSSFLSSSTTTTSADATVTCASTSAVHRKLLIVTDPRKKAKPLPTAQPLQTPPPPKTMLTAVNKIKGKQSNQLSASPVVPVLKSSNVKTSISNDIRLTEPRVKLTVQDNTKTKEKVSRVSRSMTLPSQTTPTKCVITPKHTPMKDRKRLHNSATGLTPETKQRPRTKLTSSDVSKVATCVVDTPTKDGKRKPNSATGFTPTNKQRQRILGTPVQQQKLSDSLEFSSSPCCTPPKERRGSNDALCLTPTKKQQPGLNSTPIKSQQPVAISTFANSKPQYRWTPKEDQALLAYIHRYGAFKGVWPKVSEYIKNSLGTNRSASAASKRYKDVLSKKLAKNGVSAGPMTCEQHTQTDIHFKPNDNVTWSVAPQEKQVFLPPPMLDHGQSSKTVKKMCTSTPAPTEFTPILRSLLVSPVEKRGPDISGHDSGFATDCSNVVQTPPRESTTCSRKLFSSGPSKASTQSDSPSGMTATSENTKEPQQSNKTLIQQVRQDNSDEHQHQQSNVSSHHTSASIDSTDNTEQPEQFAETSNVEITDDHSYGKKSNMSRKEQQCKSQIDHTYGRNAQSPGAPGNKGPAKRKKVRKRKIEVGEKVKLLASRLKPRQRQMTRKEKNQLKFAVTNDSTAQSIANYLLAMPVMHDAVVDRLAEQIGKKPESMRNRKKGFVSVLMRKDVQHLRTIEFIDFVLEYQEQQPDLFRMVLAVMNGGDGTPEKIAEVIPRLALNYGQMMQTRVPELNGVQRVIGAGLAEQLSSKKVYDRLQRVGVSPCFTTVLDVSKSLGETFIQLLIQAHKDGHLIRFIGDNLNFMRRVAFSSLSNKDHMVHMFAMAAIVTEKEFHDKSDMPDIPLQDLGIDDITVTPEVYAQIKKDLIILIGRIISKFIPELAWIRDCLPKQLFNPHPEYCKKTKVIPGPVKELNEQKTADVVKILDIYQEWASILELASGEKIRIGGDLLTAQMFRKALLTRLGNVQEAGRYANLGPTTFEFFHLAMNYLERMVFDVLWNTEGEDEIGTLKGEKERVVRDSVDPNVPQHYEQDKVFFLDFVTAHVVEAALDYFSMEQRDGTPTKNIPAPHMTQEERKDWVFKHLGNIVDMYAFPYWTGNDKETYVEVERNDTTETIVITLANGDTIELGKAKKETVTVEKEEEDKKKTYAHYTLETGLTFMYLLELIKTPDRTRIVNLLKLILIQLRGRSVKARYTKDILLMIMLQLSEMSEKEANRLLLASFVNTRGRPWSNVPADLQMEWIVRILKTHIKHMFSNNTMTNIESRSQAIPGLTNVANNFDTGANCVVRSKKHKPKDLEMAQSRIMNDLRIVRPFEHEPGRAYRHAAFDAIKTSSAKNVDAVMFQKWFEGHKKKRLLVQELTQQAP